MGIFKRWAFIFVTAIILSVGSYSQKVEAYTNISWYSTNTILENGKVTVQGYFSNNGDVGAYVTRIKFTVRLYDKYSGAYVWSETWYDTPNNSCYVPAYGTSTGWDFWHYGSCPGYSSSYDAYVDWQIWWN